MNIEETYKQEEQRRKSYYEEKGEILYYVSQACCNCNRARVELYNNDNLICEKCGTDQKTKETYKNEYGSWNEFDNL